MLCNGSSPIEDTIEYESWGAGRRAYSSDRRIEEFGESWEWIGAKSGRLHLALTGEHRPMEGAYWVLRSSTNLMAYLVQAVEHIENHLWRWMTLGELSEEGFEERAMALLDEHLGHSWRQVRDGAAAIMRVAPVLDNPTALVHLRRCHAAISGEMNAMDEALEAMVKMIQNPPTGVKGIFGWLAELNTIRRSVGLRVMPTPFGVKILGKRAAMKARRVSIKAIKAFSRFAQWDDVKALTEGRSISVWASDGLLEFRISMMEPRREVMDEGDLVTVDFSDLVFEIPRIAVYTRDGEPLAKVCVYVRNTPLIDQVTGLKLMIESGHESDLVTEGNWFDINDPLLFEQLVVNRYKPVHVIDSYGEPETRRLYGEATRSAIQVAAVAEDPDDWRSWEVSPQRSVVLERDETAFEYEAERFDPLLPRARAVAKAWLWTALKGHSAVLDVALRANALVWPDGRRPEGSWARLADQMVESSLMRLPRPVRSIESSNQYSNSQGEST